MLSYLPLDIWADLLEEQGENTSALRAWIEIGIGIASSLGQSDRIFATNVYGEGDTEPWMYLSRQNYIGNGFGWGDSYGCGFLIYYGMYSRR